MFAVILLWWVASKGGATAAAIYGATVAAATFVAVLVASPFGDNFCKIKQIRYGTATLVGAGLLLLTYSRSSGFQLSVVLLICAGHVVAMTFVNQARATVMAEFVAASVLPAALRIRKTVQAITGILGPLVTGVVLGASDVARALGWYNATVVLAALVAVRLPVNAQPAKRFGGFRQWRQDLQAGVAAKWRMPMERGWTVVNFIVWMFQGPAVTILIPIKMHSLGLSGQWLGMSLGALSAGVLLGSVWGATWLVARFGRHRVRVGLGVAEGIFLAIVGVATSGVGIIVALFVCGLCHAASSLVGATHRALAIPQHFRIRIFAVTALTMQIAGAIGPALLGIALTYWRVGPVYAAFGLLSAMGVLGLLRVPRFQEFLSLEHDHVVDWYAHQYPAIFAAQPVSGGSARHGP